MDASVNLKTAFMLENKLLSPESRLIILTELLFCLLISFTLAGAEEKSDSAAISKMLKGRPGAFVLFDRKAREYYRFNKARCAERYLPASTFKIPNSLIGLESGVITDENYLIEWDGIKRWNADWNRDHTLASAIKYSVVPYYQDLARRVGQKGYEKYFKYFNYGNNRIGNKVDEFWLDNSLRVSAEEQVLFLKQFYEYTLPFSRRNIDIVKNILPEEKYSGSKLKYKTGTGTAADGKSIGWLVGYVEKEKNVFFFAFNVEAMTIEEARDTRDSASRGILRYLKIIE
jgi:beta-lactamase class D